MSLKERNAHLICRWSSGVLSNGPNRSWALQLGLEAKFLLFLLKPILLLTTPIDLSITWLFDFSFKPWPVLNLPSSSLRFLLFLFLQRGEIVRSSSDAGQQRRCRSLLGSAWVLRRWRRRVMGWEIAAIAAVSAEKRSMGSLDQLRVEVQRDRRQ